MEPKKKGLLVKVFDATLFAPSKYLDKLGNNPHASRLSSAFNQPHHRVLFFTIALSLITAPNRSVAIGGLGATIILVVVPLIGEKLGSLVERLSTKDDFLDYEPAELNYYFDTSPKKIVPVPPNVLADLLLEQQSSKSLLFKFTRALPLVFLPPLLMLDSPLYALAFSVQTASFVTLKWGGLAEYWRSTRALNNEWAVMTSKPEKETQEAFTPVPVRS